MFQGMRGNIIVALIASLSLGLAPFYPEPHIVGKLRWVLGGAEGMAAADWGDMAMHGAPWLVLIGLLGLAGVRRLRGKPG